MAEFQTQVASSSLLLYLSEDFYTIEQKILNASICSFHQSRKTKL